MSKPIHALSDEQLEHLIQSTTNPAHRAIITLLADTGLRVGELVQLTVSDLTYEGNPVLTLEVRTAIAKNKTPRSIPLSARVQDSIRILDSTMWRMHPPHPSTWAIPNPTYDHPLTTRQVQRIVKHWGLKTLNFAITPHTLRHTFATRLMRRVSIRIVQQLLGHKSLSSTQVYTHPNSADLRSAIDTIEP